MKRLLAGLAATAAALSVAAGTASADGHENQVMLMHGIPGVTVDVAVGGEVLLPGFEPGATQDLTPFAGQELAEVTVFVAGTEDVAIGPVDLAVPESGNWTVLAHLDADGNPTVGVFENNIAPTVDGQGRLTVRHTAAAPAVDLVVGDARPIEGAANGDSAELELPAGEISGAQLAPAGGDPIVDVPTVNLANGTNLIVYAVGSLEAETFTFYTQEIMVGSDGGTTDATEGGDGTPAPTEVNTGGLADGNQTGVTIALAVAVFALALTGFGLVRRSATVRSES